MKWGGVGGGRDYKLSGLKVNKLHNSPEYLYEDISIIIEGIGKLI